MYFNALSSPKSDQPEIEQSVTIKDIASFLSSHQITYDSRSLEYFCTFHAKASVIRLEQIITIFVPNSRLHEAKSSTYSDLAVDNLPVDKLRLMVSVLIAELVFADTALTLFVEELNCCKPSVIDAYFDGKVSYSERILKLYASRTGEVVLPEALEAMARRLGRSSIETKLISKAFKITILGLVAKNPNLNSTNISTMHSYRDHVIIDPNQKPVKLAIEGREMREDEIGLLPSILGSCQFTQNGLQSKFDAYEKDPFVFPSNQVSDQDQTFNIKKLDQLEYDLLEKSLLKQNKDSFRIIENHQYDDKHDDATYRDVSAPIGSFRVIQFAPKKEPTSVKSSSMPPHEKTLISSSHTNSQLMAIDRQNSLFEKSMPMTEQQNLKIENIYEANQSQTTDVIHNGDGQNSPQKSHVKKAPPNPLGDSRSNLPVRSGSKSKVFVSKAEITVPINEIRLSSVKKTPGPPARTTVTMSSSPQRKSIIPFNAKPISPSQRHSVNLSNNGPNIKRLTKSPSVAHKSTVHHASSQNAQKIQILENPLLHNQSKPPLPNPANPTSKLPGSAPSISKVPTTSHKSNYPPIPNKITPRTSLNLQSDKKFPPSKRGSVIANSSVKSPVNSSSITLSTNQKHLSKSIASERTSMPPLALKSNPLDKNIIGSMPNVLKEDSSQTNSLGHETSEFSDNPHVSSLSTSHKGHIRRNTFTLGDPSTHLPHAEAQKCNSLLFVDVCALANFDKRDLKHLSIGNEEPEKKTDYDADMILKSLEVFERKNNVELRNFMPSPRSPTHCSDEILAKSERNVAPNIFTDHSFRQILNVNAEPPDDNRETDNHLVKHIDTPMTNLKDSRCVPDDPAMFKNPDSKQATEEHVISKIQSQSAQPTHNLQMKTTDNQGKVNADQESVKNPDSTLPMKTSITTTGHRLSAEADLENDLAKSDEKASDTVLKKAVIPISKDSLNVVNPIIADLSKRVFEKVDEAVIRFNSNSSNNEEMGNLLVKYTDVSFQNNVNEIYTSANVTSEYINTDARKFGQAIKRDTLDRNSQNPLTSTTQIFDNLHFNYLNNFADTQSNLADTRNNLSLKNTMVKIENFDSFSKNAQTPDEDWWRRFFPAPETKPVFAEDHVPEKSCSFTNKHNIFLNTDFSSRDSIANKVEKSFVPKSTFENKVNESSQISPNHSHRIDTKNPPLDDIKLETELVKAVTVDNIQTHIPAFSQPRKASLQNLYDSKEGLSNERFLVSKKDSEVLLENQLPNISPTMSSFVSNVEYVGDNATNSNDETSIANQELGKSLKNSEIDFGKKIAINSLKNINRHIQSQREPDLTNSMTDRTNRNLSQARTTVQQPLMNSFTIKKQQNSVTSNQTIGQSFTDPLESIIIKNDNLGILELTDEFTRINSQRDLIGQLATLFKKILVYSFKLERVKLELLNDKSEFNIFEMFQVYDHQKKGRIGLHEFSTFIADIGVQASDRQCQRIFDYTHSIIWPDSNDRNTLSLLQFANLFLPFSNDNRLIARQIFEMYENNKNKLEGESIRPRIHEVDFHLMRQIMIFQMRKIEDLTATVRSLRKYKAEEAFFLITKGERKDITWKIISDFLEQNKVRFLDEDLVHVFRDFKSKNMGTISFLDFSDFLRLKIW